MTVLTAQSVCNPLVQGPSLSLETGVVGECQLHCCPVLPGVHVEETCTRQVSCQVHVWHGSVCPPGSGDWLVFASSCLPRCSVSPLTRICVGSFFSGVNCSVYVASHFDYCKCTPLWSHCAGKTKTCLQIIYSILGLNIVSTWLKFPFTSLGDTCYSHWV